MPWNDNANPGHNPGPWGAPPRDERSEADEASRRRPPSPPPPAGPDLAEYLRRLRAAWDRRVRGRHLERFRSQAIAAGVALFIIAWLASGIHVVGATDRAVVTRFGAYDRTDGPGVRWRLPYPIERAQEVEVGAPQRTVIGGAPDDSLVLTRDQDLANVSFAVEWRVTDPRAALFGVRDTDEAVKAAADVAVRAAVGRRSLGALLTGDKTPIEAEALAQTRQSLSRLHAGIEVTGVTINSAEPAEAAGEAWRDVAKAGADAQAASDQAAIYAAKKASDASGQAAKIASDAVADQERVVHEANGEASRFDQVLAAYRRAPAVTRERLYLETMEKVLTRANTVVVDAKGAQVVLSPPATPAAAKPPGGAP
jgi:modulator of FtsH protease HflK